MSEDESFNSFYSKLNEEVVSKFNLGEKTEDSKIVRKILRSLPESFHAKVTAIEESKDLDDVKVQELIGSLQTYELSLPNQRKRKSFALKTVGWMFMTLRMMMQLRRTLPILQRISENF